MSSRPSDLDPEEDEFESTDDATDAPLALRRWKARAEEQRRRLKVRLWREPLGAARYRELERSVMELEVREGWQLAQAEHTAALKELLTERLRHSEAARARVPRSLRDGMAWRERIRAPRRGAW